VSKYEKSEAQIRHVCGSKHGSQELHNRNREGIELLEV
jgi:hypothetical protein